MYTAAAKNLMLDALRAAITHVGAFQAQTPLTAVTGSDSTDLFTKTAHGLSAGDLVAFSDTTGGTGIVEGKPYFVIAAGLTANAFAVSHAPGGAAVSLGSDVTDATVTEYVELAGGSPAYARKAIAYAAAADGQIDDSTNGAVIDAEGGDKANALGLFSALTNGTLYDFLVVSEATDAAQFTVTVTDSKLHLNAAGT